MRDATTRQAAQILGLVFEDVAAARLVARVEHAAGEDPATRAAGPRALASRVLDQDAPPLPGMEAAAREHVPYSPPPRLKRDDGPTLF